MNFMKRAKLVGCMKEEEAIRLVVMFAKQVLAFLKFRYEKKEVNILEGWIFEHIKQNSSDRADLIFISPEEHNIRSWVKILKIRNLIIAGFTKKEAFEYVV